MKLKNLVSIMKKAKLGMSNKDGKIDKYIPITKNTFPVDKYSECIHCGHAVASYCNILGINTTNNIITSPLSWNK